MIVNGKEELNQIAMKNSSIKLAAICISFLGISSVTAQTDGQLGLKAGLNSSTLTVNNSLNRTGFHAGLFYRSDPVKPFGYQAELLYSTRGADWRVNLFGLFSQEASVGLSYIDLPVMAVYRPLQSLELHGGAYLGYLVGSDYSASGTLINEQGSLGHGNFNALDFGALLGLAVSIGPVQLGARYNFGLTGVSNSATADFILGDARNRFGQVYVAYILPAR